MKITALDPARQRACPCGSWLKHWEKFSGQKTIHCPVIGCLNKNLVGAHVQKAGELTDHCYIFPLCDFHNQSLEELEVADAFELVSANEDETCKKRGR